VGEQRPQGTMLAGRANHGDRSRRPFILVSVRPDRAVRMANHGHYRTLHIRTADTELVLPLASDDPNRLYVKTVIVEQSEPAPGVERDK